LGAYQRSAARFHVRRPFTVSSPLPIVSFTFDDFPRSALLTGGAILNKLGFAGTYYASFGLMGTHAPTGDIFRPEDLEVLQTQGHELGCHTFSHCHSWETPPEDFERSILKNQAMLRTFIPGASFRTFSYPISPPRPMTKRKAARHFMCCRGGGQSFNVGTCDLDYLAAFFIEKCAGNRQALASVIDENRGARGWLILATHDVCRDPTPFGCSPDFFEAIVQCAVDSGARILPVVQALEELRASNVGTAQ
jgi:peptidoglycan/xylan/chitin deacetylase (PgdA/CDA1 family)